MRYQICKPVLESMDPRQVTFDSLSAFHQMAPIVGESDLEQDAVDEMRRILPDGLVMPVPVEIGVGKIWMLGVVDGPSVDIAEAIPFVVLVRAIPENKRDQMRVRDHQHFNRMLWRPPVLRPTNAIPRVHVVQVRASDLEQFGKVELQEFRRDNGHTVLYCEVGGIELSIEFLEETGVFLSHHVTSG